MKKQFSKAHLKFFDVDGSYVPAPETKTSNAEEKEEAEER
jgi:hypothetical protein